MTTKKNSGYGARGVIRAIAVTLALALAALSTTGCPTEDDPPPAAHVHQWGEYAVTTPATCVAKGVETSVCKLDATHTTTREIDIDPDAHDWDDKEVTKLATCIATGEEAAECKLCGVKDDHHTIPIDSVNGHNWGTAYGVTTPATETTDGIEAIMCTLNNEHFKDDTSRFSGEYATGTAGLAFEAIGSTSYRVRKGTVTEGVVHIPAMRRPNATSPYLPVTEIGTSADGASSGAFASLPGITFISIPENVTAIGANAFYNCTGLTEIAIPASVTTVHNTAFNGCTNLRNITIETDQVTGFSSTDNWGTRFHAADNLSVTFTKDVGASAFRGITRLASVTFAAGVTTIGNQAFLGCTGLTSVTIPAGVTTIGQSAFMNCTGLTSVTIPASVTTIDVQAFNGCTNLASITIGAGVTTIGNNAFNNCTSLASVTVDANNTAYATQDGILYNKAKTEFVFIPSLISGNVTLPEGITSIAMNAFYNRTGLVSVTIGAGVTTIGNNAFLNCTGLVSVTIPASVTTWNTNAFQGCTGLTSVTLTEGLTSIGQQAFPDCTGLVSVTIPASVTSIGSNAFRDCTSLTSVTFAGTIASTGFNAYAFNNLGDLRDKYLAAGTGGIGTYTRAGTGTTESPYVWTKG